MALGICLVAAGLSISLPLQTFTLAWDHSIEKIRWEEDYQIAPTASGPRLLLTEARIRGSGAGMDPPPGAVLRDGVWHYTPTLGPLEQLNLPRSDKVADYSVCWQGHCHLMAELVGTFAAAPLVQMSACLQTPGPKLPSDHAAAQTDAINQE